jgi:hypothetical protein
VFFYQATGRNINFHTRRRENLKSHILLIVVCWQCPKYKCPSINTSINHSSLIKVWWRQTRNPCLTLAYKYCSCTVLVVWPWFPIRSTAVSEHNLMLCVSCLDIVFSNLACTINAVCTHKLIERCRPTWWLNMKIILSSPLPALLY